MKKNQPPVVVEDSKMNKLFNFTTRNIIITLALLLTLSVVTSVYLYQRSANDPQKMAEKDLQETIEAVGKLMVLPTDETPTLATVSDPEKLKDQSFFANAKLGDKVLIYSRAKKAILYNPESNKIVEVAPLNLGGN